jgi:hypothetical protein
MDSEFRQLSKIIYSNSIYNNQFKFELAGLALFVVFIIYRYFIVGSSQFINVLAVIIVVLGILYIRTRVYIDTHSDSNQILDYKLNELQIVMYQYVNESIKRIKYSNNASQLTQDIYKQWTSRVKLSHFYTDSTLIHFCHSIIFLYDYNPESFASIMIAINNILVVKTQLYDYYQANGYFPDTTTFDAQMADSLHKTAVNYLHTFIYTIPRIPQLGSDQLLEKLTRQLYKLLKPHIVDIKRMAIKRDVKVGVNRTTQFTELNSAVAKGVSQIQNQKHLASHSKSSSNAHFDLYI